MNALTPVNLASHVIVREERDSILLFNGANAGLVSIRKSDYATLTSPGHTLPVGLLELYAWLYANGFFALDAVGLDARLPARNPDKAREAISDGFFDLRSDLSPLHVLWAVTPRCNLRCIYCFPNAYEHSKVFRAPSLESLQCVAEQLVRAKVLKVTISGGECLLIPNTWEVVRRLKNAGIRVTLLSNGTTIDASTIEMIKTHQVSLGISLDAPNEQTNAITRGPGAFRKTVHAIDAAATAGVSIAVLVTVTRHNFPLLDEHLSFLESIGVRCVTLQDLRPFGTKEDYDRHRLTVNQETILNDYLALLKAKHPACLIYPTELLSFSKDTTSGRIMNCPAGDNNGYIDFYGDLYPCTSLPSFKLGNLIGDSSLIELWQRSEAITTLRQLKAMPLDALPECSVCSNRLHCEGGCRGDALFYSGDVLGLPSRCPKRLGLCIGSRAFDR